MAIATIYAHKAGRSDWLATVHVDDRSDLYRFPIGSRRFHRSPRPGPGSPASCAAPFRPIPTTSPGA